MTFLLSLAFHPDVHLSFKDIARHKQLSPFLLKGMMEQSKTDPFRNGMDLFVGCTSSDLCLVAAKWNYLQKEDLHWPSFLAQGWPAIDQRTVCVSPSWWLQQAGINDQVYCSQSFGIGAANIAAAKGVDDSVIKTFGQWKSVAYLLYVKIPRTELVPYSLLATEWTT